MVFQGWQQDPENRPPGKLDRRIFPLWAVTIRFAIDKPSPLPLCLVVING